MDEELEIIRGNQAGQLLGNKLLTEALDSIEQHFRDSIENSRLSERDVREEAYRMLSAAKLFRQHLTTFLNTGKMATHTRSERQENEIRERDLKAWDGSPDRAG